MRLLEISLLASCLLIPILIFLDFRVARPVALILLIIPFILLLTELAIDGFHLLLIPIYAGAAILGFMGLIWMKFPNAYLPLSVRKWGAFCLLLLFIIGGFCTRMFPIFELPVPSGTYRIGTSDLVLNSTEVGKTDERQLTLRIWYPADKNAKGLLLPYLSKAESSKLNSFRFRMAHTHAMEKVRMASAKEKWPVILYSPSWEGGCFKNTSLFEALASEGFIVVTIELPKDSVKLPPFDSSSEESLQKFLQNAEQELQMRTSDVMRVFDALTEINAGNLGNGFFKDRLDLAAVGVMGYSFGGAVAAETLFHEPRVKSGINLDGTLFGRSSREGVQQPFLFITDNESMPSQNALNSTDPLVKRAAMLSADGLQKMSRCLGSRGGWLIEIDGAQHSNFCDTPLYIYKVGLNPKSQREAVERLGKINFYAVMFFNKTLQRRYTPLMDKDGILSPGIRIRHFYPQ